MASLNRALARHRRWIGFGAAMLAVASAVALLVRTGTPRAADVPQTFAYQGRVVDGTTDTPLDGEYVVSAALYASPTDMTPLCSPDDFGRVAFRNGNFRVEIGSRGGCDTRQVFRDHGEVYLELRIDGDAFGRIPLRTAPYAAQAQYAEEATGPLADRVSQAAPLGTIAAYFGTTAPAGWLLADGTTIDSATRAELDGLVAYLRALGPAYQGPVATEAILPDLRGEFLRGRDFDSGTGLKGSNPDGSLGIGEPQLHAFGSHAHGATCSTDGEHVHHFSASADAGPFDWSAGNTPYGSGSTRLVVSTPVGNHTHTLAIEATGSDETRPRNVTVSWIIKF